MISNSEVNTTELHSPSIDRHSGKFIYVC